MRNAISSGMKQGAGLKLLLCMLGIAVVAGLSATEILIKTFRDMDTISTGFHNDVVFGALNSDALLQFIPVFAVLPFAGSYIDDLKSKFARFFLIRTSYRTYLLSRIITCFLCGGLAVCGGIFLVWGISSVAIIPFEDPSEVLPDSGHLIWNSMGLLFLNGGFWAVVGMSLSTLMESKYIAYASPYVLYYMLVILHERYIPDCFLLYPREWLQPGRQWPLHQWGPAILILELTVLFGALFTVKAKRRLKEL